MLITILDKSKDKFVVELGKIAAKTAVTHATASLTKKIIDEIHSRIKGKNDSESKKEEKEKSSTTKEN